MNATDPAELLGELIRCPSVTPAEAGALAYLEGVLAPLGFTVERPVFHESGTPDVENLYARLGSSSPHLMFAGHTDVVPPGREADWRRPPFSGAIADGSIYGRGAVDMKGGIACFVAAVARHIARSGPPPGSVSLLITGDEEGPSVNGTEKLLKWAAARGERWDGAIVGEPTNRERVGDMVKAGRRGSLSGRVVVAGIQGHSAYPQLADNPITGLLDLLSALLETPFDAGTPQFQPTDLQVTSVDVGNPAVNVIPSEIIAAFNIRFNDLWDGDRLKAEIERRLAAGASIARLRRDKSGPVRFRIEWVGRVSPVFLTQDDILLDLLSAAIRKQTGSGPELSTSGGTSDARFIKDFCPVADFGLVGKTMHQTNESVPLADLETLTRIYENLLEAWFEQSA